MTRLLAASLLLVASLARAQTAFPPPEPTWPRGPYAGVLAGSSEAKPGCLGVLAGGGRDCDATDVALGVFAGDQFHRFFAAEFSQRYKRVGRDQYQNSNYDVVGISGLYRF